MRIVEHRLVQDDGTLVRFVASPNVGGPLEKPRYLVMHATSSRNAEDSIAVLAAPESKASAHLVIGRDGSITQMVPFDRVAWHAGQSEWKGIKGLNNHSIAIELDNAGRLQRRDDGWVAGGGLGVWYPESEVLVATHKSDTSPAGWHRFSDAQIAAAREVAALLVREYGLEDVVGHDDIAPGRKTDPGPAFPMEEFRADVMGRRRTAEASSTAQTAANVAAQTAAQKPVETTETAGEPTAEKRFTVSRSLNVRSGPSPSDNILSGSPLPAGTEVLATETRGEWKRVRVPGVVNGISGITGWVSAQFLEPVVEDGNNASSPRRPATKGAPRVKTAAQSETPAPDEAARTEPPVPGFTAAQLAERYGLADSTRGIVARALAYAASASPPDPLTSAFLLVAIAETGTQSGRPAWTPDWLRERLSADFERFRDSFFRSTRVADPQASRAATASASLTARTTLVLDAAKSIAERTTGSGIVHVRHLLAALLVDERGAQGADALQRLFAGGPSVGRLREDLFEFVAGDGDDDNAWGAVLLGDLREPQRLSGFHADVGGGDDYLDVRPDVLALAGLIASRTLAPPLSIGLFGEWGSGKTFFMRMLRDEVGRLAREARAKREMQRALPFYKRIVQIEFNAWHYSEGNLWASLVQHIFENLRLVDERHPAASAELQEPFLEKLNVEKAAEGQARRERNEAEVQRQAAERALRAARFRFEQEAKALAKVSGENFLADLPVDKVRAAVDPALKALGLDALTGDARQLQRAVADAHALLTRGTAVFAPLLHGDAKAREREWMNLLLVLLAGPAAAALAGGILWWLGAGEIADIAALAAGVAGVLQRGTRWLHTQTGRVGGWLDSVEAAHRDLDARIARAQAENAARVREAEELLRLREADYVSARGREEEARRRVAEADARLREATVTKLLRSFIEERANSTDYRKHLGVLALIRNDFERLSNLIEEENWRLSSPVPGEDASRWPNPRFETREEEEKDEAKRINRIVLYIDDLDRCPPAKVVEVLQAVHLLLAFPLFVVVVGVDARWITRSLETRYRELLSVDRSAPAQAQAMDEFQELFGTATSHDYLEKIFQVPFWLKPMSDRACRRMVDGLLLSSVVPDPPSEEEEDETVAADDRDRGLTAAAADGTRAEETETPRADADAGDAGADGAGASAGPESGGGTGGEERIPPPIVELAPESLEIREAELRFMGTLAPLLGRSPRSLKRFVNVYLLIKARLTPYERRVFLRRGPGVADYRAVLFLLAVDTGAPVVARALFSALRGLVPAQGAAEPTVTELLAALESDDEVTRTAEWARVRPWLDPAGGAFRPGDVERLARWAMRVGAFSFYSGRAHAAPRPVVARAPLFSVTARSTRVRCDPDAAEPVPGSPLPRGTVVQGLEDRGGWKRVVAQGEVNGVAGITGWVNARYLQPLVPALKIVGAPAAAEA